MGNYNDCHTRDFAPRDGNVPESEWLKGGTLGFNGPWRTTYATNPRVTVSNMTEAQWIPYAKALKTRPPMPWFNLNRWTDQDLRALSVHQEPRPGRKFGAALRAAGHAGAAAIHPVARAPEMTSAEPARLLERGRACFERHEWNDAFYALSLADASTPLGADDLHRLASAAGLTARDEEMLPAQERLYHAYLEARESLGAARAALWRGFAYSRAEKPGAPAAGWARPNIWWKARDGTVPSRATSCRRPVKDIRRALRGGGSRPLRSQSARARLPRTGPARRRSGPDGRGDGRRDRGRAVTAGDRTHLLQCGTVKGNISWDGDTISPDFSQSLAATTTVGSDGHLYLLTAGEATVSGGEGNFDGVTQAIVRCKHKAVLGPSGLPSLVACHLCVAIPVRD